MNGESETMLKNQDCSIDGYMFCEFAQFSISALKPVAQTAGSYFIPRVPSEVIWDKSICQAHNVKEHNIV